MATGLNVLGLSVAFAAFMVIMMQLDYDWNFDRFHKDHERIYRVDAIKDATPQAVLSRPIADIIKASSPHIQAGALYISYMPPLLFTMEEDGVRNSYKEKFVRVEPSITEIFDFEMIEGSEKALEQPENVLLSESIARKLFGKESAVGKVMSVTMEMFDVIEKNYTIGGVYKDFPGNTVLLNGIYIPIPKDENKGHWGSEKYELYIKVDNPANSAHLIADFKKNFNFSTLGDNAWVGSIDYRLTPLADIHFSKDVIYDLTPKTSRQTLLVLLAIALVIMVIAAINYTNFSTALTPMRIKSINTQKVLGGEQSKIRLTLIMEAASIAIVAYGMALLFVYLANYTFISSLLSAKPILAHYPGIVTGTGIIALLTGVLAGLYPSYYMTSFPPALTLKGSFGLSPKGRQLRNILISVQYVASFALIIGASFMYLQNRYIQNAPLGYDKDLLIITDLNRNVNKSLDAFTDQLKTFPGIADVTYGEALLGSMQQFGGWERHYKGGSIKFDPLPVSYTFLKAMGISVTEGRDFREEDLRTRHGALIFNEKARRQYNLQLNDRVDSMEIVGFIPDIKFATFHVEVEPMAFYVEGDGLIPQYAYIKVSGGTNMHAAMNFVKKTLAGFDSTYPYQVRFYDEVLHVAYEKDRNLTSLITLFSLVAIFISIVGVFGLVVFDSEYRRKEIGIRKVLGSTVSQILVMFNKTYIRILGICFVLAAPVAYYAIVRWLENFAYKTPVYWWVFLLSFVIVSVITILTVTFQNYRAANANPVDSIKTD
jgi:putative ABC transport system permease protein